MNNLTVVTGGAGFIGSHLVELLVARGDRVRVVERPEARVEHLPAEVEVFRADIRDRESLKHAFKGARSVYHLAANPNLWARDRREFDALNHRGTIHVLDQARDSGAERILHASTESILTRAKQTAPIGADIHISPKDTVGPYCLSKLLAENEAIARGRAGEPIVVVNPTMPVGPGDRGLSPPTRLILDCALGNLPAIMDCTLNLIDVRDIALGMIKAVEIGRPGRRYLLGGTNLTLVELLNKVAERTGSRVPKVRVPYVVGLAFAYASELWADYATGKSPRATVTGVKLTRRTMHFDASESLAELGIAPRPIDRSIDDEIAWLSAEGMINPTNMKEQSTSLLN